MSDVAIKVENLSKQYRIGTNAHSTLRDTLSNLISKKKSEEFWALRDINFEIKKGEAIGIIGRNGAGKSTLLKILSKITRPTTGRIEINGRLSALLEVGTGFHPELTGRENIYLNGSLLGMSNSEIKSKFDEIIDFSGVEKFIDTPVKHYSSGMYVRLAFSIAANLKTEVLIIDEVLAVGDAIFQKKCVSKMNDVVGEGKTILLVSHDSSLIKSLTERSILLESGIVKLIAPSNEIFDSFYSDYDIGSSAIFDNAPINSIEAIYNGMLTLNFTFQIDCNIVMPHICFLLTDVNGQVIFANNPKYDKIEIPSKARSRSCSIDIKSPKLRHGKYYVSLWLADGGKDVFIARDCVSFDVTTIGKKDTHLGYIIPEFEINFDVQ